jgi:putative flippase GtrA
MQLLRYCLVGVVNTAVSLAMDGALLAAGVPVGAATAAAFAAGAVCGYELNRRFTFAATRSLRDAGFYAGVTTAGLGLQVALVEVAAAGGVSPLPAYVAVLPIITAGTFTANRTLTYGRSADVNPPRESAY